MDLDHQQGMAAEVEEVIVQTNCLKFEDFSPYLYYVRFQMSRWERRRWLVIAVTGRVSSQAVQSCPRSTLPLVISGISSICTNSDGIMYSGSVARRKLLNVPEGIGRLSYET